METSTLVAIISAAGAVAAAIVAGVALGETRKARRGTERSASSAERSAAAAEASVEVARRRGEDDGRRWRQEREALLDVVLGTARGNAAEKFIEWRLTNVGGSAARDVRTLAARVDNQEWRLPPGLLHRELAPGHSRNARIELPRDAPLPPTIRLEVLIRYVDDIGPHENWYPARRKGE